MEKKIKDYFSDVTSVEFNNVYHHLAATYYSSCHLHFPVFSLCPHVILVQILAELTTTTTFFFTSLNNSSLFIFSNTSVVMQELLPEAIFVSR